MDIMEALEARHAVRSYTEQRISGETVDELRQTVAKCNGESGLSIQLCIDEPKAFSGLLSLTGKFKNVRNYVALIGNKGDPALEEKCGYYGQKIVLTAQQLGLNSCWVGLSYSKGKSAALVLPEQKLLLVIALGYGETTGVAHKSKPLATLYHSEGPPPPWFLLGMEAAQLAPTALNQQKFHFGLKGDTIIATTKSGSYTRVDLGIAKYHFEVGAGTDRLGWA